MNRALEAVIESILACPHCHGALMIGGEVMECTVCASRFRKEGGKYFFRDADPAEHRDALDRLKDSLKRYHRLYGFLMSVVAPTLKLRNLKRFVADSDAVVIDLGSGNKITDDRWIRIDYFDYPNVHIVCDSERLPIRSGCVDYHYNVSLLEHVPRPQKVVAEIHRTLKKGGDIVSSVPFLVPFHASPHDFHRFTSSGVKLLFRDFTPIDMGIRSGPFSSLLWIFQETIASLFSFGSTRLRNLMLIILYLISFPLKILDLLFLLYPKHTANGVASNFYFVGRKH